MKIEIELSVEEIEDFTNEFHKDFKCITFRNLKKSETERQDERFIGLDGKTYSCLKDVLSANQSYLNSFDSLDA